jgi:hypothetical protein
MGDLPLVAAAPGFRQASLLKPIDEVSGVGRSTIEANRGSATRVLSHLGEVLA